MTISKEAWFRVVGDERNMAKAVQEFLQNGELEPLVRLVSRSGNAEALLDRGDAAIEQLISRLTYAVVPLSFLEALAAAAYDRVSRDPSDWMPFYLLGWIYLSVPGPHRLRIPTWRMSISREVRSTPTHESIDMGAHSIRDQERDMTPYSFEFSNERARVEEGKIVVPKDQNPSWYDFYTFQPLDSKVTEQALRNAIKFGKMELPDLPWPQEDRDDQ